MEKLTLNVKQGSTYSARIILRDENEVPINLSNHSVSGFAKYLYGNSGFRFNLSPKIVSGASGELLASGFIDINISPAFTRNFPVVNGLYEIKRYDASGNATRTVYGDFNVLPGVTRVSETLEFPAEILGPEIDPGYLGYVSALENPSTGNLSLSILQKNSINTFISGAKHDDFWNYTKALYVLSWNSYGAKSINIKNPSQYQIVFNNYGALTSGYIQGNGLTSYASPSGLNLNDVFRVDAMTFGLGIINNTNQRYDFGNGGLSFHARDTSLSNFSLDGVNLTKYPVSSSSGQWGIISYSDNAKLYLGSSTLSSLGVPFTGTISTGEIWLGGDNGSFDRSTSKYTYFMIGSGFSEQRLFNFNTRIQTLLNNI